MRCCSYIRLYLYRTLCAPLLRLRTGWYDAFRNLFIAVVTLSHCVGSCDLQKPFRHRLCRGRPAHTRTSPIQFTMVTMRRGTSVVSTQGHVHLTLYISGSEMFYYYFGEFFFSNLIIYDFLQLIPIVTKYFILDVSFCLSPFIGIVKQIADKRKYLYAISIAVFY